MIYVALKDDEVVYVGSSISDAKKTLRDTIKEEYGDGFDETDSFYTDLGDDVEIQTWKEGFKLSQQFFNKYLALKEVS